MSKSYFLQFGTGKSVSLTGMSPTFLVFMTAGGATMAPPSITELPGTGIYTFSWGTTTYIGFLAAAATTLAGDPGRYVVGSLDPVDRMDEVGTSLIAIGTSLVALGTSNYAFGTSIFALGTSHVAQGVSILAQGTSITAQSVSLTAQGLSIAGQMTSLAAQGLTISAQSTSLFAIGVSNLALGTTIYGYAVSLYASQLTLGSIGLTLQTLDARIGSTLSSFGTSATDPGDLYGYMKRIQEFLEGNASFTKATGAWSIQSRGGSVLASKSLANSSSSVTKS